MTEMLFREDSYLRDAQAKVVAHTLEGGIVLDRTVFYPKGGGQPGDSGELRWDNQTMPIATAIKGDGDEIVLIPAEPQALPPVGAILIQELGWERRYKHMRVHTALHLLSVAVPFGVTGGSIGAGKGRLDFDMPDAPENREIIEHALQTFVEMDVVCLRTGSIKRPSMRIQNWLKRLQLNRRVGQGVFVWCVLVR